MLTRSSDYNNAADDEQFRTVFLPVEVCHKGEYCVHVFEDAAGPLTGQHLPGGQAVV